MPRSASPILLLFATLVACAACAAPVAPNRDVHGPRDVERYIARLEDAERDAWQKPDEVIRALDLPADAIVADLGCGPGYFTIPLARAVPEGVVFAVDVEPRQLDHLNDKLDRARIDHVVPVLAALHDPRLPPSSLDLVLVVDTYHHFDDRADYLARLRRALVPTGRVVDVDFTAGTLPVGPPPEHKLAREQVIAEFEAAGFALVEEHDFLPYQYFLVFGIAEE